MPPRKKSPFCFNPSFKPGIGPQQTPSKPASLMARNFWSSGHSICGEGCWTSVQRLATWRRKGFFITPVNRGERNENRLGLRREAKRHAAFERLYDRRKRCRRYALPPHSKKTFLSS